MEIEDDWETGGDDPMAVVEETVSTVAKVRP